MSEKLPDSSIFGNVEREKPKNRIRELLQDEFGSEEGITLADRRIAALPKNLPEEILTKRVEKIQNYFGILRQLRDRLEEQWHQLNKEMIADNELTPQQMELRKKYVESIEPGKLGDMLEQWKAEWEEVATNKKDKKEIQELHDSIDAANELEADIANW